MFTGIISAIGHIARVDILDTKLLSAQAASDHRLHVETPSGYLDGVSPGDSIALNGACMTVTHIKSKNSRQPPCFTVDISAESLAKTTGLDTVGQNINLEKALRAGDLLGGHIVSGHVDGVARVARFVPVANSWVLHIETPLALAPYCAYKGSIAINGVSLTINQVTDSANACTLSINLIPHTLKHTTLGALQVEDKVNIEVDTIARYVARMLGNLPEQNSKQGLK